MLVRETNPDARLEDCYDQLIFRMGESRTDLLAWINELLQVNYTKIEQCGTGGVYCQIMDSVYGKLRCSVRPRRPWRKLTPYPSGDVPMVRVKMNAKHEYEFIANFKILQNVFKAKKIEKVHNYYDPVQGLVPNTLKPIPVEKLVKCKMQCVLISIDQSIVRLTGIRDNLEFLQWIKRFWDQNFHGNGYDPVARRRGAPTDTPVTIAPLAPTHRGGGGPSLSTAGGRVGGRTPVSGHRSASAQPNEAIQGLQAQLKEMSTHMEGLEKERDFYFAKVRSILSRRGRYSDHDPATGYRDSGTTRA